MSRCDNCNGEYDWRDLKNESFQCLGGRFVSICPECLRQLRNEERAFIERKEREKREQEWEREREKREERERERARRASLSPEERAAEDASEEESKRTISIICLVLMEFLLGLVFYFFVHNSTAGFVLWTSIIPTIFLRRIVWPLGYIFFLLVGLVLSGSKLGVFILAGLIFIIVSIHDSVAEDKWFANKDKQTEEVSEKQLNSGDYHDAINSAKNSERLRMVFGKIRLAYQKGDIQISGSPKQVEAGTKVMVDVYKFLEKSVTLIDNDELKKLRRRMQNDRSISKYRKDKAFDELEKGLDKIISILSKDGDDNE
jgi:hypothetical protein